VVLDPERLQRPDPAERRRGMDPQNPHEPALDDAEKEEVFMKKKFCPTNEHTIYDPCDDYPLIEQAASGTVIPPNLAHRGFIFPGKEDDEEKIRREHRQLICSIFSKRTQTFGLIMSVLLKTKKTKAINTTYNCGQLKDHLESKIQTYHSTGELIAAALICGFDHEVKHEQAFLNIDLQSLEESIDLHTDAARSHVQP
jgi:hypothetical protein